MAKNLNQIATAAASVLATDKMYIARSPFGVTDDRYILGSSLITQFAGPLTTKGDLYSFSTVDARLAVAVGDGKILQVSSGAAIGLAYSTPTYPSASGAAGKVLASDGTNIVYSTSTFPVVGGAAGNILISDGTNYIASTSLWPNTVATVGKIIRSDGTTNAYSTSTYPDLVTQNTILYGSAANTVGAITAANNARLVSSAAGVPSMSTTGGLTGMTEVTATTQTVVVNAGYIANGAASALVTFTLPATAAVGTQFSIQGSGAGGWTIAQLANQILHVGSSPSSTGVGGSVASSNRYDSVIFSCIVANLEWSVLGGPQGNLTIV